MWFFIWYNYLLLFFNIGVFFFICQLLTWVYCYKSEELGYAQKIQLKMYLDEPRNYLEEDLDVLCFWKVHQCRFPEFACITHDILSIWIFTVALHSTFSNGGRVLDQYQSALKPKTMEALICIRDWLFGVQKDFFLYFHF